MARVLTRQHVRAVYQPIIHLGDGAVAGYEALARPANVADDGSVEDFFRTARQEGQIRDLEWLCRRAAVDGAKRLGPESFLSLNLDADALSRSGPDSESLAEIITAAGRDAGSVVVEVIRPATVADMSTLMRLMQPYREAGMRIAIAGVDHVDESLLTASVAQPEFIKLSRAAVGSIDLPARREFAIRTLARVASGGPVPVAEGIETAPTAQTLVEIGFDLGQGYLLGRPAALDRDGQLLTNSGPDAA